MKNIYLLLCLVMVSLLFGCNGFADDASECLQRSPSEYFDNILDVAHEGSRAAQGLHFELLSAAGEPTLVCPSGPEQAVRISQRSTVSGRRLIARAGRIGSNYHIRSVSFDLEHGREPKILADKQLTATEWSTIWSALSNLDLNSLRVIPVPPPAQHAVLDGETTLFEIRSNDKYYVAVRGGRATESQLIKLRSALLELSEPTERTP